MEQQTAVSSWKGHHGEGYFEARSMQLPPKRFTILQMMFWVALVGVAMFFLKSLITFLNSPFLAGPVEEANWAPILFAFRTTTCGVALWVLFKVRKRYRCREADEADSPASPRTAACDK
jgi:hypothetical protein